MPCPPSTRARKRASCSTWKNCAASRPERSAIIASHRLSAVVNADLILVLRDGHVTETGSHDALMQRDGWYASQWRYQQLEASLDAI